MIWYIAFYLLFLNYPILYSFPITDMQLTPSPPFDVIFVHYRFLPVFSAESAVDYEKDIFTFFLQIFLNKTEL